MLKLLLIVFISNRNEVNYELCRTSIVVAAVVGPQYLLISVNLITVAGCERTDLVFIVI